MNTAARKAKGRGLVLEVKEWILKVFPEFQEHDVIVPTSSAPGEDLKLSPGLRKIFPFSIECKRQEKLGPIYTFMDQASKNAGTNTPLVICRSNHEEALVIIKLKDFTNLVGT
jgi:hypothetical protein